MSLSFLEHRYVELFLHSQPDPGGRSFKSYSYNSPGPASNLNTLLATPTNSANNVSPLMGGYNTSVVLPQQQQSANQNWNEPAVISPQQQPSYSGYSVGSAETRQGGYGSQVISGPTAGGYGTPSLIQQPQLLRGQMKPTDQWYQ